MSPIRAAYKIIRAFSVEHHIAVVSIDADKDTEFYSVQRYARNDLGGHAFAVRRLGAPECYSVRVVAYRAAECECMQFYRRGYCRHGFIASVAHYGRAPHEQPPAGE